MTGDKTSHGKRHRAGAASVSGTATSEMDTYIITKKGVALQATLGGTKFRKDDDLN